MPDETALADMKQRVLERMDQSGFMGHIGAVVDEIAHESCTISVQRRPELLQVLGYLHGGVIAFLIDNAVSIAAATLLKPGQAVLTAEFKVNFLAPARGERVLSRGRVIKPGRTTVACADVYSIEDGVERHVATGLASIAIVTLQK